MREGPLNCRDMLDGPGAKPNPWGALIFHGEERKIIRR